jgi:HrpA-like RNA helicase
MKSSSSNVTQNLPIFKDKEKIIQMINRNMVSIIQAETGSGKSTQIPQFILASDPSAKIAITQPRRMPAIAVAARVSNEMNVKLGSKVGYHIKGESCESKSTQITFMTSGILIQIVSHIGINDDLPWDYVIMDEVHERSIEIDFLLVIFKYFLAKGKIFKLVLMSATMQPILANYFSISNISALREKHFSLKDEEDDFFIDWNGDPDQWKPSESKFNRRKDNEKFGDMLRGEDTLEVFSADSRRFPIKIFYFEKAVELANHSDVVEYLKTYDKETTIFNLHEIEMIFRNQQLDAIEEIDPLIFSLASRLILFYVIKNPGKENDTFLVFLPGIQEINKMNECLQNMLVDDFEKLDVIMLHSSIPEKEHKKVLKAPKANCKRVILSTNIAESSITLPDVSYVIDFCCCREVFFNQRTMTESLDLVWAAKSTMKQRAGRSGRVSEGTVFRLLPSFFYEKLSDYQTPEMQRTCLDKIILRLKLMNFKDPKKILLETIQPPSNDQISASESFLTEMGAIDLHGKISRLGRIYIDMPFDIRVTRLCVFGILFHCLNKATLCAAVVASEKQPISNLSNLKATESMKHPEAYKKRLQFSGKTDSDLMMSVNAFNFWYQKFGIHVEKEMFRHGHRHLRAARASLDEKKFCNEFFLEAGSLREILSNFLEMKEKLLDFGVDPVYFLEESNEKVLKFCIAAAFCDRILVSHYEISEERVRNREIEMLGKDTNKVYLNLHQSSVNSEDILQVLDVCIEKPLKVHHQNSLMVIEYKPSVHEKTLKMVLWLGNYSKRFMNSAWVVLKEEKGGRDFYVKPNPLITSKVPVQSRREGSCYTVSEKGRRFEVNYLKRLEYPYKLAYRDLISGMTVKIEEDSVNYITFTDNVNLSHSFCIVCSDYSERAKNFVGKNTTLMPINEFLPYLLVLIFTPQVFYVASKDQDRYSGFSVPPHSPVEFNFLLTQEDALKINEIRDRISNFAQNNDYFLDSGLNPEISSEIIQLSEIERVRVCPNYPDWRKIIKFSQKPNNNFENSTNYGGFLPPIPLLPFVNDISWVALEVKKVRELKIDYLENLRKNARIYDVKQAYLVCGECLQIITEISKVKINSKEPLSFSIRFCYGALVESSQPDNSQLANEICTFFLYHQLEYCNSGHLVGWTDNDGTYLIGSAKLKVLLPMLRYEELNEDLWKDNFHKAKNLEQLYLDELSRYRVERSCRLCNEIFNRDEDFSNHVQVSKSHQSKEEDFLKDYVV